MEGVGIDLGTTNTVLAVGGRTRLLVAEAEPDVRLPSVVSFPPTGVRFVGAVARRRRAIDPRNTLYSTKRIMGEGWRSPLLAEFRAHYPFEWVGAGESDVPRLRTRKGDFTPEDVAAILLEALCAKADFDPHGQHAVVGVPSEFRASQRAATISAGERAGLSAVEVLDEPVATSVAYLARTGAEVRRAAVYDLGGGTFDFAVVDCTQGTPRVLGSQGDLYLGGDDIDRALAHFAAEQVLRSNRWDLRSDPEVYDRLVIECERAKIRLSFAERARIELSQVDPAAPSAIGQVVVDRGCLADLCRDLVQRTFVICDEVLRQAGLRAADLDAVFLAGGSTHLPALQNDLARFFDKSPRCEFNPGEVVAIGASLAAGRQER